MQAFDQSITDHILRPRNVGEAPEPSFIGRSASLTCGATARLSLRVGESQIISEANFKSAGCTVLVGSLSLLTEKVKGKTTVEAAVIGRDAQALVECFGDLEPERIPCTVLAQEALLDAIRQYSDVVRDEWDGDEALICTCFCVSESTIETHIKQQTLRSVAEVTKACKAGGGCGSCHQLIQEMLATCD